MKYSKEIPAVAFKSFINTDQLVKIDYAFMMAWSIDCHQATNDKLFFDILKNGFEMQCRKPVARAKISPLYKWLREFEQNLLDYTKTTYDMYQDTNLYISEGYIRLDVLQSEKAYDTHTNSIQSIKFDFRASSYEYWDEFGLVLQSRTIYDLFSNFHKLHPSIEIPELNIS
jgi:hypothetical protein